MPTINCYQFQTIDLRIRKKSVTFAAMFEVCRKYVSVLMLTLLSLFVVALCIDELSDVRRVVADLCIETCVEFESSDVEWDDNGADNGDGQIRLSVCFSSNLFFGMTMSILRATTIAMQSDKQKLGLVRRYAPRKLTEGAYYAYM